MEQGDLARKILVDLKRFPRKVTGLQHGKGLIAFLDPCRKDLYFKGQGPKSGPSWNPKVVPPGGVRFLPLHLRRCAEGLQAHLYVQKVSFSVQPMHLRATNA